MREYLRPWKLVTLALGIGLLIAGSFYYRAPDWDIPISVIMAILAYLSAPWSLRVFLERRWHLVPIAVFLTWFTVDGCYWIYWHYEDPAALALMRSANFPASLSLYGFCAIGWLYRGSLRELLAAVRRALHGGTPDASRIGAPKILECAILDVKSDQVREFEAAFAKAEGIISASPGYLSHELRRCVEKPNRYLLLVRWRTLEDHTEGFRKSASYQDWKKLLHHFYDPFPAVEHYEPLTR